LQKEKKSVIPLSKLVANFESGTTDLDKCKEHCLTKDGQAVAHPTGN